MLCAGERLTWKSRTEEGYSTGEMDCSIVCTHMMPEAWELGLGSVWVRLFEVAALSRAFALPPEIKPICLLPVGYAAAAAKPARRHSEYRPPEEMVKVLKGSTAAIKYLSAGYLGGD